MLHKGPLKGEKMFLKIVIQMYEQATSWIKSIVKYIYNTLLCKLQYMKQLRYAGVKLIFL